MNKSLISIVFYVFLVMVSCRQPEKSNEMLEKAIHVFLFSELSEKSKVDSSLILANMALELDNKNVDALRHKTTLLFRNKDINGLLQAVDKLIKLRPGFPMYLGQKAIYLGLKGDTIAAREYYNKAFDKYEKYLKKDSLDFDLRLEYIGILEASGDTASANRILEDMKKMDFKDFQKEILGTYKEKSVTKNDLIMYWNGEIELDQIGE